MKPDQDWPSVWPGPRTFHPASVPLPVRQGFAHLKGQSTPGKYANVELMKIPNFLHLTPPAIKRHCEAIQKFCTPWPKGKIILFCILFFCFLPDHRPRNDTSPYIFCFYLTVVLVMTFDFRSEELLSRFMIPFGARNRD